MNYGFYIIIDGITTIDDSLADRVYESGCSDCTLISSNGIVFADFDREGTSHTDAIASAIADLERIGLSARLMEGP